MSEIKVLIVDDHAVVRQGLRTFLELQDNIVITGEAKDGTEAIKLVQQQKPDVILMDLVMQKMDGISATKKIIEIDGKANYPM